MFFFHEYEHKLVTEDFILHQSIRFLMLSFLLLSIVDVGFKRIVNRMSMPTTIFVIFYLSSYLWGIFEGSKLINVLGDLLCVFSLALRMMRVSDLREVVYAIVIFIIVGASLTIFPLVDRDSFVYTSTYYSGIKEGVKFTNPLAGQVVWLGAILSITTIVSRSSMKFKILAIFVFVAVLLSVVIIQSRTTMGSILVAVIVALVISKKWYFVASIAAIACVIGVYGHDILTSVYSFDTVSSFKTKLVLSDLTRFQIWTEALRKFWEFPLIGGGVGTASLIPSGMGTHSGVLTLLVDTGLIGISLFFYAVCWALHRHWIYMKNSTSRISKWYYTLMIIGLISYVSRMFPNGNLFGPFLIISLIYAENAYLIQKFNKDVNKDYCFSNSNRYFI